MAQKIICLYCGNEFIPSRNDSRIKYCSSDCKERNRWKDNRNDLNDAMLERYRKIVELYDSDYSTNEIAEMFGCSNTVVYSAWKWAKLPRRLTQQQKAVMSLRKQGKCCAEIADELDLPTKTIYNTASAIGMPFTEAEKEKSIQIGYIRAAQALAEKYSDEGRMRRVSELHPGWTWVSGAIGTSGPVKIRCDCCQNIIERSANTIRGKNRIVCPTCAEAERQRRQKEEEQERLRKEREREERFWKQDFTQSALSFRICPECGTPHLDTRRKYCSEECSRKVINRRGDHRIRHMRKVDKSISLKKLYLRDRGKCWICGDKCDFNDCRHDENGNFIVGLTYPSIDHVYPISKGGAHSWDNVKLAHHYCNTLKNDKVVV